MKLVHERMSQAVIAIETAKAIGQSPDISPPTELQSHLAKIVSVLQVVFVRNLGYLTDYVKTLTTVKADERQQHRLDLLHCVAKCIALGSHTEWAADWKSLPSVFDHLIATQAGLFSDKVGLIMSVKLEGLVNAYNFLCVLDEEDRGREHANKTLEKFYSEFWNLHGDLEKALNIFFEQELRATVDFGAILTARVA